MCGIAGILNHEGTKPKIKDLKKTCSLLKFRGPDDFGTFHDKSIGLVHTRLAIRDISGAGRCPMATKDRNLHIVFNGEIYNWRELRKELQRLGYKFKSNSDTEVVLNGYDAWNEKIFIKLEGMYALAIWNRSEKSLVLGIDRAGEKPIYFHSHHKFFSFGSNIQSVSQHQNDKRLNPLAIACHLSNCYISSETTIWENIQRLPPATFLKIRVGGTPKVKKYWDFVDKSPIQNNFKSYLNSIDQSINESVLKCLDADVPVGVFLSGGVDSSLVAAIAKKFSPKINAFSLGYKEENYNELPYAEKVADHLSIKHNKVIIDVKDVIETLPHLVKEYGQPFGDASAIPTYHISKFARKTVKVCLSGDGGDELFGGYWRMQAIVYANNYRKLIPENFRKYLIPFIAKTLRKYGRRLNALNTLSLVDPAKNYTNSESWFDILTDIAGPNLEAFIDKNVLSSLRVGKGIKMTNTSLIQKVLYDDIKNQLPDALLTKVDVASMAASLEVRNPFLDKSLMELSWLTPDSYKLKWGKRKLLLKRLACNYVPSEVIYRRKMGFGIPLDEWFLTELGEYGMTVFKNSISESSGLINKNTFEKYLYIHRKTKAEATRLWLLLWLELWLKSNSV